MEHPFVVEEYVPPQSPRGPTHLRRFDTVIPKPESVAALPPFPNLPPSEALLLTPADPQYADYLPAANLRTQLAPALRAVCKTENAVAVMTNWVRSNGLSFAVRCGGHSYEGFSQSTDVVIDLRGLQEIAVDTGAGLVTAGAGVSLYDVYQELANVGYAFPAGSCPTVGIAGHALGGGHGLLARSHGLTCDNLQQVTLIDAQANTLKATATSEPDLFWACRGDGGDDAWKMALEVIRTHQCEPRIPNHLRRSRQATSGHQGCARCRPNSVDTSVSAFALTEGGDSRAWQPFRRLFGAAISRQLARPQKLDPIGVYAAAALASVCGASIARAGLAAVQLLSLSCRSRSSASALERVRPMWSAGISSMRCASIA
jgi:FAD binding domain